MAEEVLSNLVAKIFELLESQLLREIKIVGVQVEIGKLKETLRTIKPMLPDGEEQHSEKYRWPAEWLRRLKDALYEADDLLDDFATELNQRQVITGNNMGKKGEKVSIFFSISNQLCYCLRMAQLIKRVREKIDVKKIYEQFALLCKLSESPQRELTHSFVRADDVIGREDDKNAIIQHLLVSNNAEDDSVIAIVGIGGLGKTTLAQLVYNDEMVISHFEFRLWVCVSENFNVEIIAEKILKSFQVEDVEKLDRDQQQICLRRAICGRRYLLVLDDIWNENRDKWLKLKSLLMGGVPGSKILITTRSRQVTEVTGTFSTYILKGLNEDSAWSLFAKMAYKRSIDWDSDLEKIGKGIVEKCAGVPLAIITIGHLLYRNGTKDYWLQFKKTELWKLAHGESDIIPSLKLSYNHLSSHLKQCFAYCALFPKNYKIEKRKLIQLWMAEGFLQSSNQDRCLEDVGNDYFMNLLSNLFFQDPEYDEWGNVIKCKMHVLMHDLTQLVAGIESSNIATSNIKSVDERCRHISLYYCEDVDRPLKFPNALSEAKHIRTLLLSGVDYDLDDLSKILTSFRDLRALDFGKMRFKTLPRSIGKLKHLRFLKFENDVIEKIPSSLSRLLNLETLDLSYCSKLKELPRNIKEMVNLKHLLIEGCNSLIGMPCGLRHLTNLQTLSIFVVPSKKVLADMKYGGLDELNELKKLRGEIVIKNLGCARDDRSANLEGKESLQFLNLHWGREDRNLIRDEKVLENLKPHQKVKAISFNLFMGVTISSWLSSIEDLTSIEIFKCERCRYIPSLDQLPKLKRLNLRGLNELEYVSKEASSSNTNEFFPSLESLTLHYCPRLKGWWRRDDDEATFLRLYELDIKNCPNLTSMPLYPSLKKLSLMRTSSESLKQTMMGLKRTSLESLKQTTCMESTPSTSSSPLSELKSLYICDIWDLESLPEEGLQKLTSLENMDISSCPRLTQLSQGIKCLTSLQSLRIEECTKLDLLNNEINWQHLRSLRSLELSGLKKLESIPEGLLYVTTLEDLQINFCPNLMALPERISLSRLHINNCGQLSKKGEMYWQKFDKIRNIEIDWKWIRQEGRSQLESE